MEWLIGDRYVFSASMEFRLKRAITFDPTDGSRLNFYTGFQRMFSLGKLWNRCLVTRMSARHPWLSAQKRHNFWSERWIALKFLQWFPEAIFLGVVTQWLLGDEYVWSVELEYRLKRSITFDPTVRSRSNFYRGFQRLFSLGKLLNHFSVARTCGRQPLVSAEKGHNVWSDCWIALKCVQGFPEAVFLGVAMEGLLSDGYVLSASIEYRLTRAITFDPTIGSLSNFYMGFHRMSSLGKLWNRCLVTRMAGRQPWVSAQQAHNFWSDRWIMLKF
jgi:hypothetical protein